MIGLVALAMAVLAVLDLLAQWLLAPRLVAEGGFPKALWRSVIQVLDPSTVLQEQFPAPDVPVGTAYRIATIASTILAILLLSTLIGILGTGVQQQLTRLRKGRSPVAERRHTVVLGWSEQVHTIISELVEANLNQRYGCVALLAAEDKVGMEDAVKERVGATATTRVVCRSGDPTDMVDIDLANPARAKSVIILPPAGADPDIAVVKSLLAVTGAITGARAEADREPTEALPGIVTCIEREENLPIARIAGGPTAAVLNVGEFLARVLVQTSLQSGLSMVYTELLSFEGDEIYVVQQPELTGRTFREALFAYQTSTAVGLMSIDGTISLNPPAETRLQAGDRVVVVTEDDDTAVLSSRVPDVRPEAIAVGRPVPPAPVAVLLLGWNKRAPEMLRQLAALTADGSRLDVVADTAGLDERVEAARPGLDGLEVTARRADPALPHVLDGMDLSVYQHIIVVGGQSAGPHGADSRTLATLLQLRHLAAVHGHGYSIVTEMVEDRSRTLAQVAQADDFIVGSDLLSLRMAQTAENPDLHRVFDHLFGPDGCQIRLRPAIEYVRPDAQVNFYTIVEAALGRDEIALGYRVGRLARQPPDFGVVVNPDKAEVLHLTRDDKVIVLAGRR
jgi:voltage-gated potassium channel Kch